LDIGSSTCGLLRALAEEFKGASLHGVEPSGEEAELASRNGVPTRVGLLKELDFGERRFDLIVCSQMFNHLLNPRLAVERVRRLLSPNGVLFLECMDFFRHCEVQAAFFNAVQIDHLSMFVPDTLKAICEAAGLEVLGSSVQSDRPIRRLTDRTRLRWRVDWWLRYGVE
jgi:2-polyprenyl-3-methyl-5-hydroxy-6-metoxy-1,4-benzoquinol methylase